VADLRLSFPLFVKPVAEGTGKGINGKSRVSSTTELQDQCAYVIKTFRQPALVETYLPGREITVGVIGSGLEARVIGAIEIESLDGAESHAYSYYNKANYEKVIRYSKVTDNTILKSAEAICLKAWRALRGRDVCRMDLRADSQGRLSFIEVNALPGLHPRHSDLPIICERSGICYTDLIGSIVDSARRRYGI
jgi:D-alanine-D-alanine ligase